MSLLEAFLQDIAADPRKRQALGIGDQMMAELQAEAARLNDESLKRTWTIATPQPGWEAVLGSAKIAVSAYRDGKINRPWAIRKVGSEIWIGCEWQRISRWDDNWSFLGYWNPDGWGDWQNPEPHHYTRITDFAVDETNGRIAVCMHWSHRVKCFDLDGNLLWEWGDGTVGDFPTLPSYPISCEWLPNGNLAVAMWSGRGDPTAGDRGYLCELDGATGGRIAAHLMDVRGGFPEENAVYNPYRIRLLEDGRLYVCYYHHHAVAAVDPATWEVVEIYYKPAGWDVQSVNPTGVCLNASGDEVVVCANAPKRVVALGRLDHDYKWHLGETRWDDRVNGRMRPGEFQSIVDLLRLQDGLFAVVDIGNNRVHVVPSTGEVAVPYQANIPTGFRIDREHLPEGFDPDSMTFKAKISETEKFRPILLPLVRG